MLNSLINMSSKHWGEFIKKNLSGQNLEEQSMATKIAPSFQFSTEQAEDQSGLVIVLINVLL